MSYNLSFSPSFSFYNQLFQSEEDPSLPFQKVLQGNCFQKAKKTAFEEEYVLKAGHVSNAMSFSDDQKK
ncbi:hypothetical protein DM860_016211 [Cuscuta australis]|uniref:Uncharacterized protein n=1 Tax=Cuscuta australis TaxID=267555 RepID=A0A328DRX0_9ASTE|nr:hypothetical protein DM860_016211 [Cuscuta australis]